MAALGEPHHHKNSRIGSGLGASLISGTTACFSTGTGGRPQAEEVGSFRAGRLRSGHGVCEWPVRRRRGVPGVVVVGFEQRPRPVRDDANRERDLVHEPDGGQLNVGRRRHIGRLGFGRERVLLGASRWVIHDHRGQLLGSIDGVPDRGCEARGDRDDRFRDGGFGRAECSDHGDLALIGLEAVERCRRQSSGAAGSRRGRGCDDRRCGSARPLDTSRMIS